MRSETPAKDKPATSLAFATVCAICGAEAGKCGHTGGDPIPKVGTYAANIISKVPVSCAGNIANFKSIEDAIGDETKLVGEIRRQLRDMGVSFNRCNLLSVTKILGTEDECRFAITLSTSTINKIVNLDIDHDIPVGERHRGVAGVVEKAEAGPKFMTSVDPDFDSLANIQAINHDLGKESRIKYSPCYVCGGVGVLKLAVGAPTCAKCGGTGKLAYTTLTKDEDYDTNKG